MIPERFVKVIKMIHGKLTGSDIVWALTGSTSFAIQGLDVVPKDIDIQTDKEGAYRIEELFSEYVVERVKFKESELIRSHFGKLVIDGIDVEIMGDIQKKVDGNWEPPVNLPQYILFVDFQGLKLPVLSLEYEAEAYRKLHRYDRARVLSEFTSRSQRTQFSH